MKRKKVTKKVEPRKKETEDKASTRRDEKVFDITKPGKGMPSSSSRPVIVSHKPSVQDPMVSSTSSPAEDVTGEEVAVEDSAEKILKRPKKLRIEPLNTTIETDSEDEEDVTVEDQLAQSEDEQKENPDKDDNTKNEGSGERDDVADAAADVATKKQAQEEAEKKAAEREKRQAEVNTLIANKQFFVPINAVKKRRAKLYVFLFLLALVFIAVGFLAALDAELIDIGITPPTNYL